MQKPALTGRLLVAVLLVVISSGCQSSNPLMGADLPAPEKILRADKLVADATGATATQRLLAAAALYNSAQAYAKAIDALNRVDTNSLSRSQRADFLLAAIDAQLGNGDIEAAWHVAARPPEGRYGFVADLSPEDAARVGERRALVLERRGQSAAAARERGLADRALPASARDANEDALWNLLMHVGREPLRQLETDSDTDVRAWAALARLAREGADSPGLLAARIDAWMSEHAGHPAATRPPAVIRQARGVKTSEGPVQVAVLVPAHGKLAGVGAAIRHGVITAWFEGRANGANVPVLRFYDSSRSDFNAVYDEAVHDGAQVVIGPLEKENLKLLQARASLGVVTIALNYPDAAGGPAALHFFGLAPEDETTQVVKKAIAAGQMRAAALVPAGEWGQRMSTLLAQEMREHGGELRTTATYQGNGDYNDVVHNLLEIAASDLRHDRIERVTGLDLGFEAQRRQDIDCLFILGNTLQGTQLAPAVQYQHGNNLPMYSISNINGQPTATSARDLAGIRFVEMPWIADPGQPLRQKVADAWRDPDERYLRLYALGIDAWKLGLQLPVLAQTGEIDGVTGVLTLGKDRSVHRRLDWMVYRNGHAESLDDAP